ncbi:hypothetical protein C8R43DRAFT_917562 [Mycena crocata]|nr:hypothetical protein C8R43DRAFT_917562 [Mycena crocata]
MPTEPQIDYVFEDIPRLADAKCIADALRTVIMTRLLRDRQTREERVVPVLMENLSIASPLEVYPSKTQDQVIEEVSMHRFSHSSDDPFLAAKSWLSGRFERRHSALGLKRERLQLEYQTLHERWRAHCASLNQQAYVRPVESENVPVSGRTTRRTAANLGDTVRSDLEMEQIIASLGYDEATDPNQLSARNLAMIPDMICVTGATEYIFDDTNHLVENPSEYYAPCTGIHDWTEPEKELFLDKYAAFPKQFGAIAEFLPNKTASQCVDYYYLHKKKLIDFRRVVSQLAPNKRKRRRAGKQKGNGLLSDIRQHDAEVNRDSDESPSYTGRPTRGRRIPESRKPSVRRNALHLEDTPTATPTPEPEARLKRRRAAASRSLLFQDDIDDDTDGEPKKKKRGRKPKSALVLDEFVTPLATPPIMDFDLESGISTPPQWSDHDKALFLDLLARHGENFKRIAVSMPNKTTVQVADYFTSNFLQLDLGAIVAKALETSTAELPENTSVSRPASPVDTTLSSAPSPLVSTVILQDLGSSSVVIDASGIEKTGSIEPAPDALSQIDAGVVAPAFDANQMWDSMDPGSGAHSPAAAELAERTTPSSEIPHSDRANSPAAEPVASSASKPPPPMSSLARDLSTAVAGPSTPQNTVTDSAPGRETSEKDQAPQETTVPAPAMSSLTHDPTWGYHDAEGIPRPTVSQPNGHAVDSAPRPFSPAQPVPYATPIHPPNRPPAGGPPSMMHGPFAMPYPYYIPPPYPSTSYQPYTSYKS